jgi:GMP synthase-like glutamine amidotransferase
MRIHVLQHVPFEGPGAIAAWAHERGHAIDGTFLYAGHPLPELADFDWLVVMGGPMGVHDEAHYRWLAAEKQLISRAVEGGMGVLGICLGAQLIASVLGAEVRRNEHKEIGWFPVELTGASGHPAFSVLPRRLTAFHWHGETFDLPAGAVLEARSEACANQAFSLGRKVVGLQFHLETTPESLDALVTHGAADITEGPFVQNAKTMCAARQHLAPLRAALYDFLDALVEGT